MVDIDKRSSMWRGCQVRKKILQNFEAADSGSLFTAGPKGNMDSRDMTVEPNRGMQQLRMKLDEMIQSSKEALYSINNVI